MEQDNAKGIFEVLAEVQDKMAQPTLNAVNPHFKNKYADLSELWRVVREATKGTGLFVRHEVMWEGDKPQSVATVANYGGQQVTMASVPVNLFGKPQEVGSAITYAKRYSLAMAFGLAADEDDDGEAAIKAAYQPKPARNPEPQPSAQERIEKGIKALMGISPWTRQTLAPILEPLSDDEKVKWLADAYREAKVQMAEGQR